MCQQTQLKIEKYMKIILKRILWDLCVGLKRDQNQASVCDGVCNILIQWRGKHCAVE